MTAPTDTDKSVPELTIPDRFGVLDGHDMTVLLRYGTREGETSETVSALLQDLRDNLISRGAEALGCVVFDSPMCIFAIAVKTGWAEWPPARFASAFRQDDRIVVLRGPYFARVCTTLASSMNDALEAEPEPVPVPEIDPDPVAAAINARLAADSSPDDEK